MPNLSRRPQESFTIELSADVDPFALVSEVFNRPITVRYTGIEGDQIKLEIDTPSGINIVRGELLKESA